MQMTPEEIVRDYRGAKDKKAHVKVLAELNCCTTGEIAQILDAAGEKVDKRYITKRQPPAAAEETAPPPDRGLTMEALREVIESMTPQALISVNGAPARSVAVYAEFDETGKRTLCVVDLRS